MKRGLGLLLLFTLTLFVLTALSEDELVCDTHNNGCAGLPITWVASGEKPVSGFRVYRDGSEKPVFTVDWASGSAQRVLSFTPDKGGSYFAVCVFEDSSISASDPVPVADKMLFGAYEQDGKGGAAEPIEWTILGVKDNKALLITRHIIHNNSYFNPWWIKYKYTYWAYSYIGDFSTNYWGSQPEDPSRRYNIYGHDGILMEDKTRGTEEQLYNSELHCRYWCNQMFYYDAFTDEERARILLTHNENPDNPDSGVKGGPDTDDYVFFLSAPEVYEYLPTNDSRKCIQTQAAINERRNNQGNVWWLRSPGQFRVNAMIVYGSSGRCTTYGTDVGHSNVGYRPCVWIEIGG